MSGVIMDDGQQWERCNNCCDWVKFQDLCYEPPSPQHDCGRDLCNDCFGLTPLRMERRRVAGRARYDAAMVRLNADPKFQALLAAQAAHLARQA